MNSTASSAGFGGTGSGSTIATGSASSTLIEYARSCLPLSMPRAKILVLATNGTGREKQHMAASVPRFERSAAEELREEAECAARGGDPGERVRVAEAAHRRALPARVRAHRDVAS